MWRFYGLFVLTIPQTKDHFAKLDVHLSLLPSIAPLHFSPLLLHSWQLHHLGLADRRHLKTTITHRLHCKRWCFIYFYYIVPRVCAIWENMRFYTISWNVICNNYCDICWLWGYLNLPRVFLYREKRFTRWLWNKIQTVFETKNYFIRWIQKR